MAEKDIAGIGRKEVDNSVQAKNNALDDDELDSLLDDALQDFSNTEAPYNPGSSAAGTDPRADSNPKPPDKNEPQGEAIFCRDFGDLFSQDDFAKMTEELSKALQDLPVSGLFPHEKESDPDGSVPTGPKATPSLEENLESAWKSLAQNIKDTQDEKPEDVLEKDLMKAFQGLGLENAEVDPDNFMTALQGMVTTLLSKDILYPSLKEMQAKYPTWLKENKTKLSEDDYGRYVRQQELVSRLCCEFEGETENESDEGKKLRLDRIMDLMQKMQQCGHPPSDLLGPDSESNPDFRNWPTGVQSDEQCVCM
ncbi:peroxisomal biogenesis factor 19-like [Rhopilema esculentum]|uniref:peroxisomal biogenesis factor 19-like n=1 Tax=Rhopilema esculentum TaxID=499914 RepID=UPI0031E1303E